MGPDPADYFNLNLDSYGRQPSLLSHYKLSSELPKQIRVFNNKKNYFSNKKFQLLLANKYRASFKSSAGIYEQ